MAAKDLENGPERGSIGACCTMCCAWVSFVIWTLVILLLIFAIAFFAFVKSNLPEVNLHRLDIYNLNVSQPTNENEDAQLIIDVQISLNVTNTNKKMMLSYGRFDVETTIEGFPLPKIRLEGFRQQPNSCHYLKIRPPVLKSLEDEDDAVDLDLSAKDHELVVNVMMKGKIGFWFKGHLVSRLPVKIHCDDIDQSEVDEGNAPSCNVKLNPFR